MLVTSNLAKVLDRDTVGQILRLMNPAKMLQALRELCQAKGIGDAYGLTMVRCECSGRSTAIRN
jgi:hypothetical protein